MLKFPPIKPYKFSGQFVKREYLSRYDIYKYKTYDPAKNCYTAFVYVHPEILAEKSICNPAGIPRKSLKIDFLRAIIENEGYGAKMLEFSKIASR